ncbi:AAA family ATPase [Pseudomonas sp. LT1P18]|uniref:AAA family ATPase n=1 Tax=Pseudomonas arabinosi TaxID=3398357 RepID=UPI0039EFFC6D
MKFKFVDIVGFRAYAQKGDGTFSFLKGDGNVSNFVSIYAPNGFGKSSFYDAMEWAITNNIGRYIRDSQRTLNQSTSLSMRSTETGQRILKNRYIGEDALSYVSVVTDGQLKFQKKVRKAAPGHRDYTYEPKSTDQETKHLANIFLSQDAIDSFLKEDRPERRYEKFMEDFGGEDEKYRLQLFSLQKLCLKESEKLSAEMSALDERAKEPQLEFSIDKVNELIEELLSIGVTLPKIDMGFSELEQLAMQSKILESVSGVASQRSILHERLISIKSALQSIPSLTEELVRGSELQGQFSEINENKVLLDDLSRVEYTKNEAEIERVSFANVLEELRAIRSEVGNLLLIVTRLSELKRLIEESERQVGSQKLVVESQGQKLSIEQNVRLELDASFAALQRDIGQVEAKFIEVSHAETQLSKLKTDISDIVRRGESLANLKRNLQSEVAQIEQFQFLKTFIDDGAVALFKPDEEFIPVFHQSLEREKQLTTEIRDLDDKVKELDTLSQDHSELIGLAKSLLSRTLSSCCPVCDADYEQYGLLLSRIQRAQSSGPTGDLYIKRRDDAAQELIGVHDYLDRGVKYLDSLKSRLLDSSSEKLATTDRDLTLLENSWRQLNEEIKQKANSLDQLKAGIQNSTKEQYLHKLQSDSLLLSDKLTSSISLVSDFANALESEKLKLTTALHEKEMLEVELATLNSSNLYLRFGDIKNRHQLSDEDIISGLDSAIHAASQDLIKADDQINALSKDIHKIREKIAQINGFFSTEMVSERWQFLTLAVAASEQLALQIEGRVRIYTPEGVSSAELKIYLEDEFKSVECQISDIQMVELKLNNLLLQISDALPFISYWLAREKFGELEISLDQVQALQLTVSRDLRVIERQLKNKIDGFFYTDLISSIYRKIDPHPFFKTVRFEPVFPAEDKPRLEVYVYEESSVTPISPSLYFSSAQINILSLSIFLARALHVEHDGQPVRAILIDDPIQSMDSINILSVIDLLRNISINLDRQIILSTHDENFYELLKLKIPSDKFGSKFLKFKSFGVVIPDDN